MIEYQTLHAIASAKKRLEEVRAWLKRAIELDTQLQRLAVTGRHDLSAIGSCPVAADASEDAVIVPFAVWQATFKSHFPKKALRILEASKHRDLP